MKRTPEVRLYDIRGPPVKAELGRTGGAVLIAAPSASWMGVAWCAGSPQSTPARVRSPPRPPIPVYAFAALALAQRAITAFLAASLRSVAVIAAALAGPPTLPPRRPRATAIGFLRFFLIHQSYVSGRESQVKYSDFPLDLYVSARVI